MKTTGYFIKNVLRFSAIVIPVYIIMMLGVSTFYYENPHLHFIDQVKGDIINPFDPDYQDDEDGNETDYIEKFKQFEGYVILASATEAGGHDLHLFALPGQKAQIYRNYSIYIFTNQPCYYQVMVDDQLYERGHSEWKTKVRGSSPYSNINIEVTLINETNATLPVFKFKDVTLLYSPWETGGGGAGDEDEEEGEEWIRFSQGEFNTFIAIRIVSDIIYAFLGVVAGISFAAVRTDTLGIQRVF